VSRLLAAALGWRRGASAAAWTVLSAILALTVTPQAGEPIGVGHCLPDDLAQVWSAPLHGSGGVGGGLLNVLLFLPLGAALVVAAGGVWAALCVVVALPAVIEVVQRSIPGRMCSFSDYLTNTAGGLFGVAVGAFVLVRYVRAEGSA
jgi:hypothetical protein